MFLKVSGSLAARADLSIAVVRFPDYVLPTRKNSNSLRKGRLRADRVFDGVRERLGVVHGDLVFAFLFSPFRRFEI